jgi:hypothetical protein
MSNLLEDFAVVTVRRDDIACCIFMRRDKMDDDAAFDRARFIGGDVMQMIADEMASMYFETDKRDISTEFSEWVTGAWENLNLDEELEFSPDTTGSA